MLIVHGIVLLVATEQAHHKLTINHLRIPLKSEAFHLGRALLYTKARGQLTIPKQRAETQKFAQRKRRLSEPLSSLPSS